MITLPCSLLKKRQYKSQVLEKLLQKRAKISTCPLAGKAYIY